MANLVVAQGGSAYTNRTVFVAPVSYEQVDYPSPVVEVADYF